MGELTGQFVLFSLRDNCPSRALEGVRMERQMATCMWPTSSRVATVVSIGGVGACVRNAMLEGLATKVSGCCHSCEFTDLVNKNRATLPMIFGSGVPSSHGGASQTFRAKRSWTTCAWCVSRRCILVAELWNHVHVSFQCMMGNPLASMSSLGERLTSLSGPIRTPRQPNRPENHCSAGSFRVRGHRL